MGDVCSVKGLKLVVLFKIVLRLKIPRGSIPVAGFDTDTIPYDPSNTAMLLFSQNLLGEGSNLRVNIKFKISLVEGRKFLRLRIRTVIRIRVRNRNRKRRSISRDDQRQIFENRQRRSAEEVRLLQEQMMFDELRDEDFDEVIESGKFRWRCE